MTHWNMFPLIDSMCGATVDAVFPKRTTPKGAADLPLHKTERYQIWFLDTGTTDETRDWQPDDTDLPDEMQRIFDLENAGYVMPGDHRLFAKTTTPWGSFAALLSFIPRLEALDKVREFVENPGVGHGAQVPTWAKVQGQPMPELYRLWVPFL